MAAKFQFVAGGLGVMADPDDAPFGQTLPSHNAGTRVGFEVANIGDEPGGPVVRLEVEGTPFLSWDAGLQAAGTKRVGYISIGRLDAGSYTVVVIVSPGSGTADRDSVTFDVS